MSVIYLDREGVEAVVNQIKSSVEQLESVAAQINSQVGSLGGYWKGASYEKTISMYDSDYKKMLTQDVPQMVDGLKTFIDNCKNAIVETDSQLAGG